MGAKIRQMWVCVVALTLLAGFSRQTISVRLSSLFSKMVLTTTAISTSYCYLRIKHYHVTVP